MNDHDPTGDVALLIDWENLKFSLLQRDRRPSVTALREAAERFGRVVYARAYADWQEHAHVGDAPNLYMAGLEPVYVLTKRYTEGNEVRLKNSVDVKLAADCIEASHVFPNIETYIIVSGDHGFIHIANSLRLRGKRVVVIGVSWTTAAQLTQQADVVLYYDIDVERVLEDGVENPPPVRSPQVLPAVKVAPAVAQLVEPALQRLKAEGAHDPDAAKVAEVLSLILTVATEFRKDRRELSVSLLGQELQKRMGSDFSRHGRGRALPLVQVLASGLHLKLVSRAFVDWIYLPSEPDELIAAEAPRPIDPPKYSFSGLVFSDLDEQQRRDAITEINHARQSPGTDYLTFNRIRDAIYRIVPRDAAALANLINNMVDIGVLRIEGERYGRASDTGLTYPFKTFALDQQDPTVRQALGLDRGVSKFV
ncbi:MAG: NYN domain-containing protein [Dehalococcoidia bacterium]